jgi:phosphohistidine phosphatase
VGGKRLLLLRHAHAEAPQGLPDIDRPLSARGRTQALDAAQAIARAKLACDAVLSSPALRARETAFIVAAQLDRADGVQFEPALYPGAPDAVLAALRHCADSISTLLIVGHNPGLSELAQGFNCGAAPIELQTAGLCEITLAARMRWRDLSARQVTAVTLLR